MKKIVLLGMLFFCCFLTIGCNNSDKENRGENLGVPDAGIKDLECPEGYFKNQNLCCPTNYKVVCGKKCYRNNCKCIEGTPVCQNEKFCAKGIVCGVDEECEKSNGQAMCVSKDKRFCPAGNVCQKNEICSNTNCCPKNKPYSCGSSCCEKASLCINHKGNKICVLEGTELCSENLFCYPGLTCSKDKQKCLLQNQDYCDNGSICPQGQVCLKNNPFRQCCPKVLKKPCGPNCCPATYECKLNKFCLPQKASLCSKTTGQWCPDGQVCGQNIPCLPNTAVECGSSWCEPGKVCKNGVCCDKYNNQICGGKCCPINNKCVNSKCVSPGDTYCQNGLWCKTGSKCPTIGNVCIPTFHEECDKRICNLGEKCLGQKPNRICCLQETPILCNDHCCATEEVCMKTKSGFKCLPQGSILCGDGHLIDFCPFGMRCGRKKCLLEFETECLDGSVCGAGLVCTKNEKADYLCCPKEKTACGTVCCHTKYHSCQQGRCFLGKGMYERCVNDSECAAPLKCVKTLTNAFAFALKLTGYEKYGPSVCSPPKDGNPLETVWSLIWGASFPAVCGFDAYNTSGGSDTISFGTDLKCPPAADNCSIICKRNGFYDGRIEEAWHGKCEIGDLCLDRAYIIDNREPKGGLHGPVGNIHIRYLIDAPGEIDSKYPDIVLRGPIGDEWDDLQAVLFRYATLVSWKEWNQLHPASRDRAKIKIFESDPAGGDDVLGIITVIRSETERIEGKSYCLHRDAIKSNPCDGYVRIRTRMF